MSGNIPYGYCNCGCGERTGFWEETNRFEGRVAGEAKQFIHGHNTSKPLERHRLKDCGYDTPCWIWEGNQTHDGYGTFTRNGVKRSPHRLYYAQHRGAIPEGAHLDHLCRNPPCVNPDHLEPVTPAENKRRAPSTKMTQEKVDELRYLSAKGAHTRKELQQMFGLSPSYLSQLINYKRWL